MNSPGQDEAGKRGGRARRPGAILMNRPTLGAEGAGKGAAVSSTWPPNEEHIIWRFRRSNAADPPSPLFVGPMSLAAVSAHQSILALFYPEWVDEVKRRGHRIRGSAAVLV